MTPATPCPHPAAHSQFRSAILKLFTELCGLWQSTLKFQPPLPVYNQVRMSNIIPILFIAACLIVFAVQDLEIEVCVCWVETMATQYFATCLSRHDKGAAGEIKWHWFAPHLLWTHIFIKIINIKSKYISNKLNQRLLLHNSLNFYLQCVQIACIQWLVFCSNQLSLVFTQKKRKKIKECQRFPNGLWALWHLEYLAGARTLTDGWGLGKGVWHRPSCCWLHHKYIWIVFSQVSKSFMKYLQSLGFLHRADLTQTTGILLTRWSVRFTSLCSQLQTDRSHFDTCGHVSKDRKSS